MQPIIRALAAQLLALALFIPALAQAAPVAVTLYPGSAEVTETGRLALSPEDGRYAAVLTLPASADPGSLGVGVVDGAGLVPADVRVKSVLRTDEGRIKEVRARLEAETAKRQDMADRREAHMGAAGYWRSLAGGEAAPKAAEARALADAVRDGLAAELAAASKLARDIAAKDVDIRELEAELKRLTGGGTRVLEAHVAFDGPRAEAVNARWTYRISGAGWTPSYSLDALPAKNRVDFAWDARIHQNSGAAWKDVALTLSTAQFIGGAEPPRLPGWNLRPRDVLLRKAAKVFSADNAMMEEAAPTMVAMGAAAPPVKSEGRVFDSYDAGRVSLASGQSRRIHLERSSWEAAFDYLVRPYQGPGAFTRAAVKLAEPPKYPQGECAFLLDSALVRKGTFSLYAKEADLYFGADPQIAVRLTPLTRQSGKAGFLGSKKSHSWDWRVTVTNGKTVPAAIRMEDRIPSAGDKRIEIDKRLNGAKEEEGNLAVWTFDLNPGQEHAVEYGYTATYPKEMDLDLGGR